jgi:DNA repair exonuclease SbcCD ATPase subunit
MAIETINFSYPKGSLQSVFDNEEMTALELAAKTSKKVDECVNLVNGVEQIALEATAVVDDMHLLQDQFIADTNDTRAQLINDNQLYIDDISAQFQTFKTDTDTALATFKTDVNTDKSDFIAQAETELTNTKNSMTLALNNFQTTTTTSLNNFTADLNTTKETVTQSANDVIANASQQITNDVSAKLTAMTTDGTFSTIINQELFTGIRNDIDANQVMTSSTAPTKATTWFEMLGETQIQITDGSILFEPI